jgi:hypothetical protein
MVRISNNNNKRIFSKNESPYWGVNYIEIRKIQRKKEKKKEKRRDKLITIKKKDTLYCSFNYLLE